MLRIGTRGSQLALWQANTVAARIAASGGPPCTIVIIKTSGDRLQEAPLSEIGGKGLFVKEIEDALIGGLIDLAVHSSKDMAAVLPDGLRIAAVLPREDPLDAIVLPSTVRLKPDTTYASDPGHATSNPSSEHRSSERRPSERRASDHPSSEHPSSAGPSAGHASSNRRSSERRASDRRSSNRLSSQRRASDRPSSDRPSAERRSSERRAFNRSSYGVSGFSRTVEGRTFATVADLVAELGRSPVVGTGSVRRIAQLTRLIPGARFTPIRGNLDTRLRKLDGGDYDVLVLAAAGLVRLGFGSRISMRVPSTACIPAPGQGIVAIEIRSDDEAVGSIVARIDDAAAGAALTAERALVAALGGGCQTPIGALASPVGDQELQLVAVVVSPDGSRAVRGEARGPADRATELGQLVAARLVENGADDILADIRRRQSTAG